MIIQTNNLPYYFKYKTNLSLSLKTLDKILNQDTCKDGDCSLKKPRILLLMSFITVNLIIATSFGLFCYHNI